MAIAAVAGAGVGVLSRPELGIASHPRSPAPAEPPGQMTIVREPANSLPPQAANVTAPPLETLPRAAVATTTATAPPPAPAAPVTVMIPPSAKAVAAASTPALSVAPVRAAPAPPPVAEPAVRPPPPQLQAGFDCADAASAAEAAVCSDPRLAAADRRMARAWRRALDSGAPPGRLRRDQRDWLAAREAIARDSPRDLGAFYDQRIRELEATASEDAPE